MSKKRRRNYTDEFKKEAVKLVIVQGYPLTEVANNFGINATMLEHRKREYEGDDVEINSGNTVSVQAELKRLRTENRRLKMEREI